MLRTPHIANRRPAAAAGRAGFTLVEMLVATTLVVLMLLLFAQIFGDTVRIMRNQQALSQNDQKARSVDSVIRGDLEKATFRQVRDKGVYGITPLRANWPVDAERQRGYVYISENDPEDPNDDTIQLTIDRRLTHRNLDVSVLKGKATEIDGEPNEPDNDDGILGNSTSESPAAEVAYFVRNGNLYRRVLLLRKPIIPNPSGATPREFPTQPGSGPEGANLIFENTANPVYSEFWNDFDFSAWHRPLDPDGDNMADGYQIVFNGVDSLQNVVGATPFPIAVPFFRFGHLPLQLGSNTNAGRPYEYIYGAGPTVLGYIGRFTQEETSSTAFVWPDGSAPASNPYLRTYPAADANGNGIVDAYENGDRAGEDLLLSGVESFDIEVWDQGLNGGLGGWADLGHDQANGLFQDTSGNFTHQAYGPRDIGENWIFDTWHPSAELFSTVAANNQPNQPPWRAMVVSAVPSMTNNVQTWAASTPVTTSTYLFPRVADPMSFNEINPGVADDDSYYYVPVLAGTTGARQPEWPREPGATVVDGGVIWKCFDNRVGLRAIRITIRFRDPGNGSPRQVSVIHSFVE